MVNPLRIKAYAKARLTRNKTDPVDADLIADFCQSEQPAAWTPPTPEMRELRELLHTCLHQQVQASTTSCRLPASRSSTAWLPASPRPLC